MGFKTIYFVNNGCETMVRAYVVLRSFSLKCNNGIFCLNFCITRDKICNNSMI